MIWRTIIFSAYFSMAVTILTIYFSVTNFLFLGVLEHMKNFGSYFSIGFFLFVCTLCVFCYDSFKFLIVSRSFSVIKNFPSLTSSFWQWSLYFEYLIYYLMITICDMPSLRFLTFWFGVYHIFSWRWNMLVKVSLAEYCCKFLPVVIVVLPNL